MPASESPGLGGLMDALARLCKLDDDVIHGIIGRSASPELMARAYDRLLGGISAVDGRTAMRAALQADSDAIDSLCLSCVVV